MAEIVILPAVNGVIFNEQGEVLLTRRSEKVREAGHWCLPGGHLEVGEGWGEALARELKEELSIDVGQLRLFGLYSDPKLTVTTEVLPDGHYGQFVVAAFLITQFSGKIETNDEVDDWDWFPLTNLPEPILKSHPIRIKDATQFKNEVFVR